MDAIRRDLWLLAWPATLATAVHHLFRLNDQFFVQVLGSDGQAAVAVGSMVAIFFVAFGEMVGIGTLAIAARRFGEGDEIAGLATIRLGLRLGVAVGCVLAAAVLSLLPWLCEKLIPGAAHAHEREMCMQYLAWIAGGQAVMIAAQVSDQAFLALKHARTSLLLQLIAVATNAAMNALLVPHFGIHGIGFATVASRLIAATLAIWLLGGRGMPPLFRGLSGAVLRAGSALRILRVGLPACIAVGTYSLVYQVMLATTIREFGPAARSALGIGFGIETIFYCLYWGTGNAVASLVGRYLGEGAPAKALAVTRLAITSNLVIGIFVSIVFLVAGPSMVALFTNDDAVMRTNVQYLTYMAMVQPFQALQVAFDNALIGAGRTLPIMISSVTMNGLRIPLAHALGVWCGWGLAGVWWALNISSVGKSVWAGVLYQRKRWLRTQV